MTSQATCGSPIYERGERSYQYKTLPKRPAKYILSMTFDNYKEIQASLQY